MDLMKGKRVLSSSDSSHSNTSARRLKKMDRERVLPKLSGAALGPEIKTHTVRRRAATEPPLPIESLVDKFSRDVSSTKTKVSEFSKEVLENRQQIDRDINEHGHSAIFRMKKNMPNYSRDSMPLVLKAKLEERRMLRCRNSSVKSATTIITNEEEISLQTIMNDTIAFVVQGEGKDPMLREPAESEWTVDRQSQSKKMQADHHAHIEKMLHVAKQSLDSTFIILTIGVSSRVLTILWKCLERELRSTTIASVYKEHLCREALLTMKKLLITMKELHAKFSSDSAHQAAQRIMCLNTYTAWDEGISRDINSLWNDEMVQRAFKSFQETYDCSFDNLKWLMDAVPQFSSASYQPGPEDSAYLKNMLSGVREVKVKRSPFSYRFVNIERLMQRGYSARRWFRAFSSCLTAVLFVADVSDEKLARLSCDLLWDVQSSQTAKTQSKDRFGYIVLVFGMESLRRRAAEYDLGQTFTSYKLGKNSDKAQKFIIERLQTRRPKEASNTLLTIHLIEAKRGQKLEEFNYMDIISRGINGIMTDVVRDPLFSM